MNGRFTASILLLLLPTGVVLAQSSTNYRLEEKVFNAGGHPAAGEVVTSGSFRITIDSIGDGIVGSSMSSASFALDAGFAVVYPPPGEVLGLSFLDHVTLTWYPEKSVGVYNLYKDLLTNLTGLGYGACEKYDIDVTTAADAAVPPATDGFFYLVTAENRLFEEGTKGNDSAGVARPNPSPCP
jgi:hypothetical protein